MSLWRTVLLLIPWTVLYLGCSGSEGPRCYPVRGQVLYRGQPLAEAMVVFHPVEVVASATPKPIAYTDAQGHFQLTTWQTHDGAPLGEYAITVELREARLIGEEMTRDGRNLLPPPYADPKQTPLRYTVVEGDNAVPPLQLSARP